MGEVRKVKLSTTSTLMVKKVYKTKGWVWVYAAENAAWHFVYVDKQTSLHIKNSILKKVSFGSVKVKVKIGQSEFETSLFPDRKSSCYLLPLKKSVRNAENIYENDEIFFEIEVKNNR